MHGNRARSDAERAIKLAPASDYARFALAYAMRLDRDTEAEALKSLRELLVRRPNDKFVLRILGVPLSRRAETAGEGLGLLARAAAQPGGDPIAEYIQGESMIRYLDRETEGLGAIDRALALAPNYADAHCEKIVTLLERRGDLEAARTALAQVPPALLRDERVMAVAVKVWLAANDPERALRALSPAGAALAATYFRGPTGYLKGMAHRRAGRLPAAQAEWRVALLEVQRRLEAAPTDPFELLWKACLLALVGEATEARAALDLARQFSPGTFAWNTAATVEVVARSIVTPDDALDGLSRTMASASRSRWRTAARIVFDPALDHLRNDPKFAALVEQAKTYYAEKQAAEAKKNP
jgi:tetratricopeptide (TPR) repeat protein